MIHDINNPKIIQTSIDIDIKSKNFTGVAKDKWGRIFYYVNGAFHREDGPAVLNLEYTAYYCHGEKHRINGPALIYNDGEMCYFFHGKLHRTDGPAIIFSNYTKQDPQYWVDGICIDISSDEELEGYVKLRIFE